MSNSITSFLYYHSNFRPKTRTTGHEARPKLVFGKEKRLFRSKSWPQANTAGVSAQNIATAVVQSNVEAFRVEQTRQVRNLAFSSKEMAVAPNFFAPISSSLASHYQYLLDIILLDSMSFYRIIEG